MLLSEQSRSIKDISIIAHEFDASKQMLSIIQREKSYVLMLNSVVNSLQVELASLLHHLNMLEDERQACEYLVAQVRLRQLQINRLAALEKGIDGTLCVETPAQVYLIDLSKI